MHACRLHACIYYHNVGFCSLWCLEIDSVHRENAVAHKSNGAQVWGKSAKSTQNSSLGIVVLLMTSFV